MFTSWRALTSFVRHFHTVHLPLLLMHDNQYKIYVVNFNASLSRCMQLRTLNCSRNCCVTAVAWIGSLQFRRLGIPLLPVCHLYRWPFYVRLRYLKHCPLSNARDSDRVRVFCTDSLWLVGDWSKSIWHAMVCATWALPSRFSIWHKVHMHLQKTEKNIRYVSGFCVDHGRKNIAQKPRTSQMTGNVDQALR